MILGNLDQLKTQYKILPPPFPSLLKYLRSSQHRRKGTSHSYSYARHKIPIILHSYLTGSPESKTAEQHKKNIDLHLIISGTEVIGLSQPSGRHVVLDKYRPAKDRIKYGPTVKEKNILLRAGDYIILFPEDIHRPGCYFKKPNRLTKIVVKIPLNLIKK